MSEEIKKNENNEERIDLITGMRKGKFEPGVYFWMNKIGDGDFFNYYYTHYICQMQNTYVNDVFDIGELLREVKKVNACMADTSPQKIKSDIMWAVLPLYGIKEIDIAFMQEINLWDKYLFSPFNGVNDMILIEEIPLHKDFVRKGIIGYLNNLARNHYQNNLCSLSIKTRNKDLGRQIVYRQFARFYNGKSSIGEVIDAIFKSVEERKVQTSFYYITQGKEQCIEDFVDAMDRYKNDYMIGILNDKKEEKKILNLKKEDYLKMKYGDELWNKFVLGTNNYGTDDKYVPVNVGLYESKYYVGTSPLYSNDVVLKQQSEPIYELVDEYKLICQTFDVMLYYDSNTENLTIEEFLSYCSKYVEFVNNAAKLYNTRLIKDIKPGMLLSLYDIDIHEALFVMYSNGSDSTNPYKMEFKRLPVSDKLIGIGIVDFLKETKQHKFFNDLRDEDYISDGTNNEALSQDPYELHYGAYTKFDRILQMDLFDYEGFFSGKLSIKEAFKHSDNLAKGVDYGIEGYFCRNCPDLKYTGADVVTFNEMVKAYHAKEAFRLCMNGGSLDMTVYNIYDVSDVDNWVW